MSRRHLGHHREQIVGNLAVGLRVLPVVEQSLLVLSEVTNRV